VANILQVDIITPKKQAYSGQAGEVRVPGYMGEFGVLPNHEALLSLLKAGICTVVTAEGDVRFVVGRGFCEVGPDRVTLLTDLAEPTASVDKAAAAHDAAEADAATTGLDTQSAEYKLAEEKLEVARARLSA
jgi:F-type H+-transporting ATPase subunit epsilon